MTDEPENSDGYFLGRRMYDPIKKICGVLESQEAQSKGQQLLSTQTCSFVYDSKALKHSCI